MQVQSLEAFEVHRDLLRAGEESYSKELLPVQAEAAEDFGTDVAEASFGGAVLAVTLQLTAQGEPTLVFVKDRRNSVRWAYRLAERMTLPPAQQAIEQLAALPPISTRRRAPATNESARSGDLSRRGSLLASRRIQAADAPGLLAGARQNRISLPTGLHKIRHMWYTRSSGGRKCGCRSCV